MILCVRDFHRFLPTAKRRVCRYVGLSYAEPQNLEFSARARKVNSPNNNMRVYFLAFRPVFIATANQQRSTAIRGVPANTREKKSGQTRFVHFVSVKNYDFVRIEIGIATTNRDSDVAVFSLRSVYIISGSQHFKYYHP